MPNVPSVALNESSPAGSDLMSTVDNRIREMKTQIREMVGVDHDFPSSGQAADNGQHLRCTFQEQANLGTGAVGATILGSQTVSGKGELVYTDEDDNDIQITTGGKINAAALGGVYAAANVAALATMLNLIYPVGSVYINATVATNPGTLLGIGTWVAIEGTVIAGYKSGDATYGTAGATVGSATIDSSHTHGAGSLLAGATNWPAGSGQAFGGGESAHTHTVSGTSASGGSSTQSTLQPTLVAYCWRRTA